MQPSSKIEKNGTHWRSRTYAVTLQRFEHVEVWIFCHAIPYIYYCTQLHYAEISPLSQEQKKCSMHFAVLEFQKQKQSRQEKLILVQVLTEHFKGKDGILQKPLKDLNSSGSSSTRCVH